MAKGSQLAQLKSALASAGLNRQSQPGGSKGGKDSQAAKKRKRGPDDEKKLAKIRKDLNPFEERVMRLKHDVGGRKIKGSTGRPGMSKQAGLEERKRTLLPALHNRHHTGDFVDRRFGEADASMTPEEKMLERFTREKQRASVRGGKADLFNLRDGDDDEGEGLTHYGKSLAFDDFEDGGLGAGLEDDDESGQIGRDTVQNDHFGGFDDEDDADEDKPERKKSKSEVMAEVIAKSKDHKYARQLERERDDAARAEIDAEFASLRDILMGVPFEGEEDKIDEDPALTASSANRVPLGPRPEGAAPIATVQMKEAAEAMPADYDQYVKALAFDRRAKPTDRTKTEEELALEEKERLEEEEKKRLKRMRGETFESDDETGKGRKGKGKAAARKPDADDLEDDFDGMDEDGEDAFGLGEGLGSARAAGATAAEGEDEDMMAFPGSDTEDDDDDEGSGDDDEGESESGEDGEDEDEDDGEDYGDLDGSNDEGDEEGEGEGPSDSELLIPTAKASLRAETSRTKKAEKAKSAARKELPFTFPCPATHADFIDLLEEHDVQAPEDVELVVKRIRAVWHPKLGEGNKERMQIFMTVLLDHVFQILAPPMPSFSTLSLLLPHITALSTTYPLLAAQHSISKLVLMQKNLSRGLARGATSPDSRTWPGPPELGLLRIIGVTWSTSDYSHPVSAPAMLLIGQYLSQARVRSTSDIASGLFLTSLVLQYESLSKRYMPEAINFLALVLLLLTPHSYTRTTLPGFIPANDFDAERCAHLKIRTAKGAAKALKHNASPELSSLLLVDEGSEQAKVDLLSTALQLVVKYAELYAGIEAFVEIFRPIQELLAGVKIAKLSPALQTVHTKTHDYLSNTLKFSLQARRPLLLQAHKPIPIASFIPKFEGSSYSHTKRYDPDAERNAASKLRSQYKQERKGAIRELRKDARFLATERNREKDEKDAAYDQRMRSVHGAITVERAEEKAMEREKARDKRRAGK